MNVSSVCYLILFVPNSTTANKILHLIPSRRPPAFSTALEEHCDSSSSLDNDNKGTANPPKSNSPTNDCPWSSGGYGSIFGIHCDITNDEYFNAINDVDGDDSCQSQSPNQSSNTSSDDEMNNLLREKTRKTPMMDHYF